MSTHNNTATTFSAALKRAQHYIQQRDAFERDAKMYHVIGSGRTISVVYEQVRNAAEYSEDHLLLQGAIKRFYKRLFITGDDKRIAESGGELVTELTLAGYLVNDTIPEATVATISEQAAQYYTAYQQLRPAGVKKSQSWTIDVLTTEANTQLRSSVIRDVFEQFAFEHFRDTIDTQAMYGEREVREYELMLFIAIHKALLKSDDATIRWSLLRRFGRVPTELGPYQETNLTIDALMVSKQTEQLRRIVSREGAVFRVLWRTMNEHLQQTIETIDTPHQFLSLFESVVNDAYEDAEARVNRGIIRSIIFLFITKALIGIAIEIPYDLFVYGAILWLPLAINLGIPPVYMLLLRLTLSLPGYTNTKALVAQVNQMLYEPTKQTHVLAQGSRQYGVVFNVIYALLIIGIFAAASWLLIHLGFTFVHLLIFFIFFSTASFLGFRLSRIMRDLETVEATQTTVSMIRDFIYLPFVAVGRKLNESYARFNVIALLLDMLIELPLKNILYAIRRWGAFISTKKDEM